MIRQNVRGASLAAKSDELFRQFLPELFELTGNSASPDNMHRIQKSSKETFSRDEIQLNDRTVMNSLGLISSIRWESYAFCKGGAGKGVNYGSLSKACFEEFQKVEKLVASVLGNDAGVLEPGFYSKEKINNAKT